MTDDVYQVAASEMDTVRVFATDLDPEGASAITASNVHKLLGDNITLDAAKVEVFPAKVIQALGLSAYLYEGYGIAEDDLKGKRSALDALTDIEPSDEVIDSGWLRSKRSTRQRRPEFVTGEIVIVHGGPPRPRWRNGGEAALDGHAGDTSSR